MIPDSFSGSSFSEKMTFCGDIFIGKNENESVGMAMDPFANEDCMISFGLIRGMKVWEWIHFLENDSLANENGFIC